MKTISEIEEQINLLQREKDKLVCQTPRTVVNYLYMNSFKNKIQPVLNRYKFNLGLYKQICHINAVMTVVLTPFIGEEETNTILKCYMRAAKSNYFMCVVSLYHKYNGDLEMRNLLKLITAIYRIKLGNFSSDLISNPSGYYSQIKYSEACNQCGNLAHEVLIQFKKLNFI